MPPRRSVRRSIISLVPPEPPKAVDSVAATSPPLPPLAFPVADTVAAVLSRAPTNAEERVAPLSNGNADVTATTGLATPRASQPEWDQTVAGPSRMRPLRTYSRAHRRAAMLKRASPTPSSDSLSSLSEPADEPPAQATSPHASLSEPADESPAQATSPHAPEDAEEQGPPSDASESEDSVGPTSKKRKAPDDDYTPLIPPAKKAPRKATGKKAKGRKPTRSESPDLPTVSLLDIVDGKVDTAGRPTKKPPSKKDPTKRTPKKKGGPKQTPAKSRTPAKAAGVSTSRGRKTAKSKAMPNPTPDQTSSGTPPSDIAMPWSSLIAEDDDDDDNPMDLMSIFERKQQSPTPDSDASSVLSDLPPPPPEPEVFQPSELPAGAKLKGACLVKDMHQWRPAYLEEFHPAQTEEEARRSGDRFTVVDRIGKVHKSRPRKAVLFLDDEAIAECRVVEFREKEESPQKSSRRRHPTPDLDLPPAGDTYRFAKLNLWRQIVAIRPHLSDILHERYAPAQWRIDAFFQSPSARNGLNGKVSYGELREREVAGEFLPELERWALGVEARTEATPRSRNARARSDSTTATEPRAPARGSERWESLEDRRAYVHLVLLPEAIIERCVRAYPELEAAEPAPEDGVDSENGEQVDGPDDAGPSAADVQDDDMGTGEDVDQELAAQPAEPAAAEASNPDQNADATAAGETAAAAVSGEPADSPPATASAVAPNPPDQAPTPKETTPVPAEPAEPQTARIASPTPATTSPNPAQPIPTPSEPAQPAATPTTATPTVPPAQPTAAAQQRTYDAACRKLEALRKEDTDWAIRCTDINNARRAMRRKLGLPEFDTVETPPPEMELSLAGRRRTKKNYKV